MQVIGLCRFSYPAIGGFQVDFPTIEERIAYLYAPKRMEERFATFETFTLPALQAQTDPDFDFIVLIGNQLPAIYREKLEKLLTPLPQATIIEMPPSRHRPAMRSAINAVRRFDTNPCLQFRMDDDDAVSIRFIETLRAKAKLLLPLLTEHQTIAIDFNQGYIAKPSPEGILAKPVKAAYQTAALGMLFRDDTRMTIMNYSHNKIHFRSTSVSFTDEDMFVRGHNNTNDSRQGKQVKHPELTHLTPDDAKLFKQIFNIDQDHVRKVFAGL